MVVWLPRAERTCPARALDIVVRRGSIPLQGQSIGVASTSRYIDERWRTTGAEDREPFDRATIAAVGPLYGGESLDDRSATTDRRCIDLWVMPNWPLEIWRMRATDRARDLAHTPAFAYTWRTIVVALHDLGERYVELHGEQVDRFLADLPDAISFRVGEPRPEAATSVGVRPP
jgi:hypothetical protein